MVHDNSVESFQKLIASGKFNKTQQAILWALADNAELAAFQIDDLRPELSAKNRSCQPILTYLKRWDVVREVGTILNPGTKRNVAVYALTYTVGDKPVDPKPPTQKEWAELYEPLYMLLETMVENEHPAIKHVSKLVAYAAHKGFPEE